MKHCPLVIVSHNVQNLEHLLCTGINENCSELELGKTTCNSKTVFNAEIIKFVLNGECLKGECRFGSVN